MENIRQSPLVGDPVIIPKEALPTTHLEQHSNNQRRVPVVEQYVRTFFPDPARAAVLVADDQENNRETLEFALQQQGFSNILLASNGHEALELYKIHAEDIVLVITDYRMPEMMGDELFRRLMEIDEGIRVVMCSGMPDERTDALLKSGLRGFVQKPFTSEQFGLALVEALL